MLWIQKVLTRYQPFICKSDVTLIHTHIPDLHLGVHQRTAILSLQQNLAGGLLRGPDTFTKRRTQGLLLHHIHFCHTVDAKQRGSEIVAPHQLLDRSADRVDVAQLPAVFWIVGSGFRFLDPEENSTNICAWKMQYLQLIFQHSYTRYYRQEKGNAKEK